MGPWLVDVRTREELDTWFGDDPPTTYRPVVMVVRGDSEVVREFLPNALDAAKLNDQRVVVWVKDATILTEQEIDTFFLADETVLAAVLSKDHEVGGWVYDDHVDVDDAAFAFRNAQIR
jgi:hypothetical protein